MGNTVSIDALRREVWEKELFQDVMDNLYFTKAGLMGTGDNNIIQIKDDLKKGKGDTITLPLTVKLSGEGVSGDAELEGNEEAIVAHSEQVKIDQKRFAVRLTGRLDEQSNAYNMRTDARNKLSIRLQEYIERQTFLKMAGVNNLTLTDVNGVTVSAGALWSNTPDQVPTADTGLGYGDRYLCADYTNGADSLATTDLLTPDLISRVKTKAMLASPKIQPLRVDGENYYCLFIHPWQAYDLKQNAVFNQARREAEIRGKSNPIFTGVLGLWDGVMVKEHEYVPFVDISAAGHNFYHVSSGTDFSADCFRAILCGQQAAVFAKATNDNGWVEKSFDYGNKTGFATGIIGGIQKVLFDSKNYGCVQLDTAATSLV